MSVKIRLSRHGTKKEPVYFVVVADSASARDGSFLQKLGQYQPKAAKPSEKLKVNMEALKAWQAKGALTTRTVGQLIKSLSE
jgi:small subunit ribosomal protein S16